MITLVSSPKQHLPKHMQHSVSLMFCQTYLLKLVLALLKLESFIYDALDIIV